eukprot:GDKK01045445.1.p1 GENE.GDKK01045445.1~~GDKK01045445.1.p1  ORF type:complete len:126 (+),score=17.12 GDKK01045445.1:14-391(+)
MLLMSSRDPAVLEWLMNRGLPHQKDRNGLLEVPLRFDRELCQIFAASRVRHLLEADSLEVYQLWHRLVKFEKKLLHRLMMNAEKSRDLLSVAWLKQVISMSDEKGNFIGDAKQLMEQDYNPSFYI